ncbi:MAG TPA: FtsX-like permease family protein, partial [Thermoanaerobaculia bacterium]|nr:FtsX-like permease family protein [Thermoanaerobaculia bacterium]
LLAESVLLAGAGGVGGLLIGWWGSRLAPALLPDLDFALAVDPHLDGRVVAFTFAASLLAVVVFGLLPARRAAAADPAGELKAGAGAGVGGRGGLRQALVAAQVALSVVVLVAAGLFLRSLAQAQQLDLGFRADEALVFAIDPGLQGYSEEAAAALQERLARRIRELPTVAGVTWADDLPLDGNSSSTPVAPAGSAAAPEEQVTAYYQRVEEGYFAQMEVPLLAGRGLATADLERETEAAVISASLAAALWPGEEAVGRRIGLAGGRGEVVEVVGVAADVKLSWLGEASSPALYFDLRRNPRSKVYFVVRHQGAAAAVAPALRQAVRELDPRLPVLGLGTLRAHLAPAFTPAENGAWLSGAFALLALLLSLSGIYGVIAYGVAQRLREMAVRLAVGASPRRLQWQVLGRALRPLGYGLVAGLVAAVAVSRLLRGLLYGVSPADPLTYTLAASVLVAAGAVAGWLPARRAARVDPAAILRSEA